MPVAMMKLDKVFIINLFLLTTLFSFLSPSIAQEMGKEEILNESYSSIDYDRDDESQSATIYAYSPGFSATVENQDPQLSNGKVEPNSGDSSTQFYYSVNYFDEDEDAPATISVYINETSFGMTLGSGLAYNGIYKSSAQILDSGTHSYYFTATDGEGGSVRLPVSESFSGPTVNDPPQLSHMFILIIWLT